MFCKTIILSNSQNLSNNSPKGILTLSKEGNYIKGKIRLYNLITLPASVKIGLYISEQVYICSILKKQGYYEFDLNNNIDISQSIYCALIDTANNKQVVLEGGTSGFCFTDSPFDAVIEAKDEDLEKDIDNALKDASGCTNCNCANCEYKAYFYQHYNQDKQNDTDSNMSKNSTTLIDVNKELDIINKYQEDVIQTLEKEAKTEIENMTNNILQNSALSGNCDDKNSMNQQQKLDFLNEIVYQLDEMFDKYPEETLLTQIIQNSKFIRVDGDSPYVVGVIYENNLLKYIAYGVPATYNTLPPKDFENHYQWLPVNPRDVMSDGYFMIYQDATNGTIVEINFE